MKREGTDLEPSPFLKTLRYILKDQNRIKDVSDCAFNAVDVDNRGYLEKEELHAIMECVAKDMNIDEPSDTDVDAILGELDTDNDARISREEFVRLIEQVLRKMEENESRIYDLQLSKAQTVY